MSYVWRSSVTLWKLVQTHYERVRYEMGTVTLEGGGCQCEILNLLAGAGWGLGGGDRSCSHLGTSVQGQEVC